MALVFHHFVDPSFTYNPVYLDGYPSGFSDCRLISQKDGITHLHLVVAGYPKDQVQVSRIGDRLRVRATLPTIADDSPASYGTMVAAKARADFVLASSVVIDNARVVDGILTITLRSENQPDDATIIPVQ